MGFISILCQMFLSEHDREDDRITSDKTIRLVRAMFPIGGDDLRCLYLVLYCLI